MPPPATKGEDQGPQNSHSNKKIYPSRVEAHVSTGTKSAMSRDQILQTTLLAHHLREGLRRHKVNDADNGNWVSNRACCRIIYYRRLVCLYKPLPRSHWLRRPILLHCPLLIGISDQVSLCKPSLGIVAGLRLAQGRSDCHACSCGLVGQRDCDLSRLVHVQNRVPVIHLRQKVCI